MIEGAGNSTFQWYRGRLAASEGVPRTRAAIYHRAGKLWGAGGLTRGSQSLRNLARATGYHPAQIQRAREALNLRFARLTRSGRCLISFDQAEDIIAWLKHDFWSVKLRVYRCLWCATDAKPHHAAGLCMACYQAHRRACRVLGLPNDLRHLRRHLERSGYPPEFLRPLLANLGRGWAPERGLLNNCAPWPKLGLIWGIRRR